MMWFKREGKVEDKSEGDVEVQGTHEIDTRNEKKCMAIGQTGHFLQCTVRLILLYFVRHFFFRRIIQNSTLAHARDNILNTFLYYIDGAFIDAVEKKVADEKIIGFIVGKALMLR